MALAAPGLLTAHPCPCTPHATNAACQCDAQGGAQRPPRLHLQAWVRYCLGRGREGEVGGRGLGCNSLHGARHQPSPRSAPCLDADAAIPLHYIPCRDFGLSRMLGIGDTHVETEVRRGWGLGRRTRRVVRHAAPTLSLSPWPHANADRTLARLPRVASACRRQLVQTRLTRLLLPRSNVRCRISAQQRLPRPSS